MNRYQLKAESHWRLAARFVLLYIETGNLKNAELAAKHINWARDAEHWARQYEEYCRARGR